MKLQVIHYTLKKTEKRMKRSISCCASWKRRKKKWNLLLQHLCITFYIDIHRKIFSCAWFSCKPSTEAVQMILNKWGLPLSPLLCTVCMLTMRRRSLPYIQNHTLIYLRNYVFTVSLAHTDKKNILLHMYLSLCLYQLFCNVFMYQHNIVCYEDYVKCFTWPTKKLFF